MRIYAGLDFLEPLMVSFGRAIVDDWSDRGSAEGLGKMGREWKELRTYAELCEPEDLLCYQSLGAH